MKYLYEIWKKLEQKVCGSSRQEIDIKLVGSSYLCVINNDERLSSHFIRQKQHLEECLSQKIEIADFSWLSLCSQGFLSLGISNFLDFSGYEVGNGNMWSHRRTDMCNHFCWHISWPAHAQLLCEPLSQNDVPSSFFSSDETKTQHGKDETEWESKVYSRERELCIIVFAKRRMAAKEKNRIFQAKSLRFGRIRKGSGAEEVKYENVMVFMGTTQSEWMVNERTGSATHFKICPFCSWRIASDFRFSNEFNHQESVEVGNNISTSLLKYFALRSYSQDLVILYFSHSLKFTPQILGTGY